MKICNSTLRAIIERVTEIQYGDDRIFVFEYLDQKGCPHDVRIQSWECLDITSRFTREQQKEIEEALYEHYRCKANSSD
jgi:hypothetical protein